MAHSTRHRPMPTAFRYVPASSANRLYYKKQFNCCLPFAGAAVFPLRLVVRPAIPTERQRSPPRRVPAPHPPLSSGLPARALPAVPLQPALVAASAWPPARQSLGGVVRAPACIPSARKAYASLRRWEAAQPPLGAQESELSGACGPTPPAARQRRKF